MLLIHSTRSLVLVMSLACCVLFGCMPVAEQSEGTSAINQPTYARVFGEAMCAGVAELNRQGRLADRSALAHDLDPLIRQYVLSHGYSEEAWAEAKTKYYTKEEAEQLTKMHFLRCVSGI